LDMILSLMAAMTSGFIGLVRRVRWSFRLFLLLVWCPNGSLPLGHGAASYSWCWTGVAVVPLVMAVALSFFVGTKGSRPWLFLLSFHLDLCANLDASLSLDFSAEGSSTMTSELNSVPFVPATAFVALPLRRSGSHTTAACTHQDVPVSNTERKLSKPCFSCSYDVSRWWASSDSYSLNDVCFSVHGNRWL
jgi:hypothetical protein